MIKKAMNGLHIIEDLVANDLKSRYSGSALGIAWAFVQPLVTILVFWYVFQLGFKNPPVDNVPYILWFIAGYIPWTFFSDAVLSSTNVFYEYSYLVKKMKFKVWLLPIIKVLSSLYIHTFFIVFVIGVYFIYGYHFHVAWLTVLYYSFCLFVNAIGVAFFVSSISVFIKDAAQVTSIILQIGFWLTPVFWSSSSMKPEMLHYLKINPIYYVIEGYRYALIDNASIGAQPIKLTIYFWLVTIALIAIGAYSFKSLRVHFADLI